MKEFTGIGNVLMLVVGVAGWRLLQLSNRRVLTCHWVMNMVWLLPLDRWRFFLCEQLEWQLVWSTADSLSLTLQQRKGNASLDWQHVLGGGSLSSLLAFPLSHLVFDATMASCSVSAEHVSSGPRALWCCVGSEHSSNEKSRCGLLPSGRKWLFSHIWPRLWPAVSLGLLTLQMLRL